jgi:hypothetical protein
MKHTKRWIIVVLIIAGSLLSACAQSPADVEVAEKGPVTVEHLEGANPTRITLTEEAAKRLDIQTAPARGNAIPYAAVLYDPQGNTWIYTNAEPLVFMRSPVTVENIVGDQAILSKSLPAGSTVVTTGAEELYGSETEFEEE